MGRPEDVEAQLNGGSNGAAISWEKDRSSNGNGGGGSGGRKGPLLPTSNIGGGDKGGSSGGGGGGAIESEYAVSAATKWAYLAAYFACNVALTLYNKSILGKFSYPWLLTAIHAGSASIGCYILELRGVVKRSELSRRDESVLLAFSVLFTINIAVSNVSL